MNPLKRLIQFPLKLNLSGYQAKLITRLRILNTGIHKHLGMPHN